MVQSVQVRRDLSHQVRVFREHTWKQKRLQMSPHRLGLMAAFKQRWFEFEDDNVLMEFFAIQDRRTIYSLCPPLLMFPLPPLLQVQPKSRVHNALDYYSVAECIKKDLPKSSAATFETETSVVRCGSKMDS